MAETIGLIGEADDYSARIKRSVFKSINRELGVNLWLAKEFFVYEERVKGWAFVGSLASLDFRTGLFISLEGHVVLFHVSPEILEISNLNFSLVEGNYVTLISNPSLRDHYQTLLKEMIELGDLLSFGEDEGNSSNYGDFLDNPR